MNKATLQTEALRVAAQRNAAKRNAVQYLIDQYGEAKVQRSAAAGTLRDQVDRLAAALITTESNTLPTRSK